MNLKNLLWLIACFFFVVSFLHAGVVSLTDAEVSRLQALVKASPDATACEKSIVNQAQEALGLSPHPIPELQAGLKGTTNEIETTEAKKDMPRVQALGLAYALTGDPSYLNQAVVYLTAWAKTCQPPDNPINATGLEPLLETYDLIRPKMIEDDRKTLDDWVRSVAETLLASDDTRRKTHTNNWQAHRLKIVAKAAFILNDTAMENQTLDSLKNFMDANLNQDGTTLDFIQRDALHYHVYDLAALIDTAILYQRAQNVDLYNYKTNQGASVSQCVAFLLPYASGQKTHAEFVNSTVKKDAERAANGEETYVAGSVFKPKGALRCLELAQYFQPELKGLAGTLSDHTDSTYPTLQVLLNEAMRGGPIPIAATTTGAKP